MDDEDTIADGFVFRLKNSCSQSVRHFVSTNYLIIDLEDSWIFCIFAEKYAEHEVSHRHTEL